MPKEDPIKAIKPDNGNRTVLPPPPRAAAIDPMDKTPPRSTAEREREQQSLARTSPLAMRFEVIGCEYAQMTWQPDKAIPDYTFRMPCPFGKWRPDQDCRDCSHMRVHPIGQEQHVAQHRYHNWGVVIPLTEVQADAVMEAAVSAGTEPLRRPAWQEHAENLRKAEEEVEKQRTLSERIANQQRGRRAGPVGR